MSDLMGKRIVFIWLLLAFAWVAKSQNYMIKGIVTDSITGEPLPYVAVILKGTTIVLRQIWMGLLRSPLHLRYVLYRSLIWVIRRKN